MEMNYDAGTWKAAITKDLKDKPYESLVWNLDADIAVEPFYTAEQVKQYAPLIEQDSQSTNQWQIGEIIVHQDDVQANTQALQALRGGVNLLVFHISSLPDFKQLFQDIHLDYIHIHFAGEESLVEESKKALQAQYSDEIFSRFVFQSPASGWIQIKSGYTEALIDAFKEVQKILEDSLESASINFCVETGPAFMEEIAKIRAIKLVWNSVLESQNLPLTPARIHASVVPPFGDDIHRNMIAASTQAISAVTGGVESLCVFPANGLPGDEFTRRIARNVQHLLVEESHLDAVKDPAAGAYLFEKISRDLADKVLANL